MSSVDITRQLQGLCQAVLLGGALGIMYDLMRVLRRRIPLRWLEGVLDFSFWVSATVALFLFSHRAWDGQIRLYGALFCLIGGGVYFWGLSSPVLGIFFFLMDVAQRFLGILTLPARLLGRLFKRFGKNAKNIFPFKGKWSMISSKPKV